MAGYVSKGTRGRGPGQATAVSRQLKAAGFPISSTARFGKHEGIFVRRAGQDGASVMAEFDSDADASHAVVEMQKTLVGLGYEVKRTSDHILSVRKPAPVEVDEEAVRRYQDQGYQLAQAVRLARWEATR